MLIDMHLLLSDRRSLCPITPFPASNNVLRVSILLSSDYRATKNHRAHGRAIACPEQHARQM
jgi:hypothetical protein